MKAHRLLSIGLSAVGALLVLSSFAATWVQDGGRLWPPSWPLVAGALLALLGALLPSLRAWADARKAAVAEREARERDERHGRVIRDWSNLTGDAVIRVTDVSPEELGGRIPIMKVPYLERDKEPEVGRLLSEGRPVLVIGRAMAGKSRMCASVMHAQYADRRLVRTVDQHFNEELEMTPPSEAVVWLDDLDKYLSQDGLRRDWLDRLMKGGNVVLATMRTSEWERYGSQDQIKLPHTDAVGRFQVVTLLSSDEAERERLASQMPDQVSAARVQRYGLGEYLGGAPMYEARFAAAHDSHPRGVALVRAAAALRRAGLDPVDRGFVEKVSKHYHRSGATDGLAEAWEWAMCPVESLPGLLEPTDPDALADAPVRVSDYISDHLPDVGLPDPVWGLAAEHVFAGAEADRFGRYAVMWGQAELAVDVLGNEVDRWYRELGGEHLRTLSSQDSLANALWKSGDYPRAISLSQETLAIRERLLGPGHPDTCASRQNLAHSLWKSGNAEAAEPLYEMTLAHYAEVHGDDHPDTLRSSYNLESVALFVQSAGSGGTASTRLRRLDEADPDALRSATTLTDGAVAEFACWITLHERTLADRVAALGEEHQDTLWAQNRLATVCAIGGDIVRAVSLYEQTLTDRKRVLGADHPHTKLTERNLRVAQAVMEYERPG